MTNKTVLKYETILISLEKRIALGEFSEKGKLPTEAELTHEYNCSRPTIRKALHDLKDREILSTIKGSGSFLSLKVPSIKPIERSSGSNANLLLGLLFQDLGPSYIFDTICNQITKIVAESGYSIVYGGYLNLEIADFKTQVKLFVERLIKLKVNGVFFAPFEYSSERDKLNHFIINEFDKANIPVVIIDRDVDDFPKRSHADLISLDHIQSGYLITNHVIQQGAKKIIFISPPNSAHTIKLRLIGFNAACIEASLQIQQNSIIIDPNNQEEVEKIMRTESPDAIICSNDRCAINLIDSLLAIGYEIPKDILIAGFDNISTMSKLQIPLTSIMQPLSGIAKEAVKTMFERIKNPTSNITTIRLPGTLIVRKSTTR
ncbi:MAG: substrate-binding domain-containing protein [Sphaerochaeta sp.]